ncbi:protein of unknown function [Acidithiobacillus ferrivorans]|uniref:Uncharacterized protein n=1 Tax=Acidithiobacillus ferrivorans TaxID=160808 RepID=A0A060USJ2_9PROT|nr:hypothetical protein AFERRI_530191 [Acidithiobacillus ferrivorans]SMH67655.1 protein of unknown function [Acidithiobacillus ferrivorans]
MAHITDDLKPEFLRCSIPFRDQNIIYLARELDYLRYRMVLFWLNGSLNQSQKFRDKGDES